MQLLNPVRQAFNVFLSIVIVTPADEEAKTNQDQQQNKQPEMLLLTDPIKRLPSLNTNPILSKSQKRLYRDKWTHRPNCEQLLLELL